MNFTGIMLCFAVVCLIMFAGGTILQDRFIVLSTSLRRPPSGPSVPADFAAGRRHMTAGASLPSRPRPRAVLPSSFTAMRHAGRRKFYAEALTRLGLRVIVAEYPGYGLRATRRRSRRTESGRRCRRDHRLCLRVGNGRSERAAGLRTDAEQFAGAFCDVTEALSSTLPHQTTHQKRSQCLWCIQPM